MKKVDAALQRFGVKITAVVGTMWCALAFAILAFISLPAAVKTHDVVVIVGWIAQTFLQLVLLSIILVGQAVQADQTIALHDKVDNHMASTDALHDKVEALLPAKKGKPK